MGKQKQQGKWTSIKAVAVLATVRAVYSFGWLIVALLVRAGVVAPWLEVLNYASQASPWLFVGWGVYAAGYAFATLLVWQSRLRLATAIYVLSYILNSCIWFAFTSFALTLVYGVTLVAILDMITNTIDLGLIACLVMMQPLRHVLRRESGVETSRTETGAPRQATSRVVGEG
ncbi:hypothetical protein [Maricaulis maris]|uniref:hypothetical protein n=1 Tax=Maricaulis maris TaxID=74318 RepID=UPI003B8C169A